MLHKVVRRIRRWRYSPRLERDRSPTPIAVTRLGTRYGGWHYAPGLVRPGQWAMLCGAGEDVSFDLALQKATGARIVIVDPTPRAVAHWAAIVEAERAGTPVTDGVAGEPYDLAGVDLSAIAFLPRAIWNDNTGLKFWEPADPAHVSYSATNLQSTDRFIEVAASDPQVIAETAGLDLRDLGLLKLDIEGAEGTVLDWFLDRGLLVPQVLLEYDEMTTPSAASRDSVRRTADRLLAAGYEFILRDGPANVLYVRR